MPALNMATTHALGREEAVRRLKEKFDHVRATYGNKVGDLREEWKGNTLEFGFKATGMKVSGTVTVEDAEVRLDAQLPFAAIVFKGMIERQIRAELGQLLA
jgi:hypothetical protein